MEGSRFKRAVALACAVALGTALPACGDGGDGDLEPVATSDPAVAFAPLVRLSDSEEWFPMSAADFVDYATLSWSSDPCSDDQTLAIGSPRRALKRDEPAPVVEPRRLGNEPLYRTRPTRAECVGKRPTTYTTGQYTRPYDGPARAAGLRDGEGFYLDLLTVRRDGATRIDHIRSPAKVKEVPAYYERRDERIDGEPGVRIDYWLLYGFDSPRPEAAGGRVEHEGDWEQVTVLLRRDERPDSYVPVGATLRDHDGRERRVDWQELETSGGSHPVVYAAAGSHTLYPAPVVRRIRRRAPALDYLLTGMQGKPRYETVTVEDRATACPRCVEWTTWQHLRPLRDEPWYGYGGGWGTVYVGGDVGTGPMGPYPR